MWLTTTEGFFSAVEDRDEQGSVLVRARVRGDLEQLADALGVEVLEMPAADYPFRVRVSKADWAGYVANCAGRIDYDNFKDAVAARQGHDRAEVYMGVWSALRRLQRLQRE